MSCFMVKLLIPSSEEFPSGFPSSFSFHSRHLVTCLCHHQLVDFISWLPLDRKLDALCTCAAYIFLGHLFITALKSDLQKQCSASIALGLKNSSTVCELLSSAHQTCRPAESMQSQQRRILHKKCKTQASCGIPKAVCHL